MSAEEYRSLYRWFLDGPEGFWAEEARDIEWRRLTERVLGFESLPFARWCRLTQNRMKFTM